MVLREHKLSLAEIEEKTGIRLHAARIAKKGAYVERLPLAWIRAAAKLPGKAMHVAVIIWYRQHLEKVSEVALTQAKLEYFGIHRNVGYRALRQLELGGLVTVKRAKGRAPRVKAVISREPTARNSDD
jgi:hypothetical protein